MLPWDFDIDQNGRITMLELNRALDRALNLMDQDDDGVLARFEVAAARNELRREINSRDEGEGRHDGGKCDFPEPPENARIVVLYAKRAGALTNLEFQYPSRAPVGMVEIDAPEGPGPVWVYAAFEEPVILRAAGKGRITTVIAMNQAVAVLDAPSTRVTQRRCVFGFLGIRSTKPTLEERYRNAIGRPIRFFHEDRIRRIDLASGTTADEVLRGDDTPALNAAPALHAAFLRERPGGFQVVDWRAVNADVQIAEARVWPEEAGLLKLATEGAIVELNGAQVGVARRAMRGTDLAETLNRQAKGRDTAAIGDLVYTRQPNGSWLGREILTLGVTRAIDMPKGLQNRRLRIAVPNGVPKPRGAHLGAVRNN